MTSQNEGFYGARAPPWLLLEPQRAFCEFLSLVPALPLLAAAPTIALREFLSRIGYDVHGWGLGRNLGPRDKLAERLEVRIAEFPSRSIGPVRGSLSCLPPLGLGEPALGQLPRRASLRPAHVRWAM